MVLLLRLLRTAFGRITLLYCLRHVLHTSPSLLEQPCLGLRVQVARNLKVVFFLATSHLSARSDYTDSGTVGGAPLRAPFH